MYQCLDCYRTFAQLTVHGCCPGCGSQAVVDSYEINQPELEVRVRVNFVDTVNEISKFRQRMSN